MEMVMHIGITIGVTLAYLAAGLGAALAKEQWRWLFFWPWLFIREIKEW
jgi:hypothetical protein